MLAADAVQNPENPYDVNADKKVSALDALIVINSLARQSTLDGSGEAVASAPSEYFLDVSGDGLVTANDALRVINVLGEGEDAPIVLNLPDQLEFTVGEPKTFDFQFTDGLNDPSAEYFVFLSASSASPPFPKIGSFTLNNPQNPNLGFDFGDGIDDMELGFSGSLADVNDALSQVQLTINEFPEGNNELLFSVTQGSNRDAFKFIPLVEANGNGGGGQVVAEDDFFTIDEDTSLVVGLDELLSNDVQPDPNSPLVFTGINGFSSDSSGLSSNYGGQVSIDLNGNSISYSPPADFNGVDSFTYSINDDEESSETDSIGIISITVNPVNDPPVLKVPSAQTISEDNSLSLSGIDSLSVSDVEGDDLIVTLSVNNGTLSVDGVPGVSGNRTGQLMLSGQSVHINSAIDSLTYTPNMDFEGTDSLTYVAEDSQGGLSDEDSIPIQVAPVNDPPQLLVPDQQSFFTDFDNRFSTALQISDVDGGSVLEVQLSLSDGIITSPVLGQVNVVGEGTGTLTYSGFTPDVIDAVNGSAFHFTDPSDPTLTVTVSDEDPVNPLMTMESVDLSVIRENFMQKPRTLTIGVNDSVTIRDAFIKPIPGYSDADPIRLALSAFNPGLQTFFGFTSLGSTEGITFLDGDGANDQNVFFEGTRDAINNALNGLTIGLGPRTVAGQDITQLNNNTLQFVLSNPDASFVRSSFILIDAINGALPAAANEDYFMTNEDVPLTFDVLGNDFNAVPQVPLTITEVNDQPIASDTSVTLPSGGVIGLSGAELTYTPPSDVYGEENFTYTLTGADDFESTGNVTINVLPVNDAPIPMDDLNIAIDEFSGFQDNPIDVLANDTPGPFEDGIDTLRITDVSTPSSGSVLIDDLGTIDPSDDIIRYQPDPTFEDQSVSFTYTLQDGGGLSRTGTVFLDITNQFAGAQMDGPIMVNEDESLDTIDVLSNDDVDGPTAISQINGNDIAPGGTASTGFGSLQVSGGSIFYTPSTDFNGTDSFTYTLSSGDPDTANVTIQVAPVNDSPVPANDSASVTTNNTLTISIDDILGNDLAGPSNESDQKLSIVGITGGNPLSEVRLDGANITYTPPSDFVGEDTFTYTIVDDGLSGGRPDPKRGTGTITILVEESPINLNAVNDGPVLIDEDSPQTIDVLSNDTVPDVENTRISQINGLPILTGGTSSTTNGQAVLNEDNTITYVPEADFNGEDSFTYTLDDGDGATSTGSVNISIAPVNDAPIAVVDSYGVFSNSPLEISLSDLLRNDRPGPTNEFDQTLTVTGVTGGAPQSTVDIDFDSGTLVYTPPNNFVGDDSLTYTIVDNGQSSGVQDPKMSFGTIDIQIRELNPNLPFATDDLFTIDEDAFAVNLSVLDNDLVPDPTADPPNRLSVASVNGNQVTGIVSVSTERGGTLTFDPASDAFVYTPQKDFFGTDTFTYTAISNPNPGQGESPTATVEIEIQPINDPPVNTIPGPQNVDEDVDLVFSGNNALTVTDIDSDDLTLDLTVDGGSLNVNPNGEATVTGSGTSNVRIEGTSDQINSSLDGLSFLPLIELDQFFLQLETNDGDLTTTDTVNITINPINDPPTLVVPGKQTFFTDFDNRFSSDPEPFRISDIDAGDADIQVDLKIDEGILSLDDSTGVTVTPNPDGANGIRILGPLESINDALGSGVSFRITDQGDQSLTVTVNDLGNAGGGGEQSVTETVEVEVLDFVPINITGQVFLDDNGDGIKDSSDPALEGLDVVLSGVDFQGNPVVLSDTTTSDGGYSFTALRPNSPGDPYQIVADMPAFIQTTATGLADTSAGINGEPVQIEQNFAIDLSTFKPEFVDTFDLFAQNQQERLRTGVKVGFSDSKQTFATFVGEGFDPSVFSNLRFMPSSDGTSGVLTVFDSLMGADRTASVSTRNGTLTFRGNDPKDRIYRIIGGPELFDFEAIQKQSSNGVIFDLLNLEGTIRSVVTVDTTEASQDSDPSFDNFVGFYEITDINGGIDIDGDGSADLNPGDAGYAQAAINQRIPGIGLSTKPGESKVVQGPVFEGGGLFAPFLIAGVSSDTIFSDNGESRVDDQTVYFSFLGANPDGIQHLQALGNNVFGFEDLPSNLGVSDNDFNDAVFSFSFTS